MFGTTPIHYGQYGYNPFAQQYGVPGYPFGIPTPGLWTQGLGAHPAIGQFGGQFGGISPLAQQFGMPSPVGIPSVWGSPFAQMNVPGQFGPMGIPGAGQFGQLGQFGQFGTPGVDPFGGVGQRLGQLGGLDPSLIGQNVDLASLARMGGGLWPNQGLGIPGIGGFGMPSMMPSFKVFSLGFALVTPTINPLAQLFQHQSPFGQYGVGQNPWQQILGLPGLGQPGIGQPWQQIQGVPQLGGRLVRTFILTPMGLIPVDILA